jgi:hypothetical protein
MNDPLNISVELTGVETTLPLLRENDYRFQIVESTIDPNKNQDGLNWNLKLGLAEPAEATDGRVVSVNFPVFMTLALQAKADSKDPEAFKRSLGEAIDAIFQTDKTNRPAFNRQTATEAVGKTVKAHIYIDNYNDRESNKVKRLKKDV